MLARIYFFPDKIDLFFKIETRRQHTYIDIDLTLNQNNMGQKDTKWEKVGKGKRLKIMVGKRKTFKKIQA